MSTLRHRIARTPTLASACSRGRCTGMRRISGCGGSGSSSRLAARTVLRRRRAAPADRIGHRAAPPLTPARRRPARAIPDIGRAIGADAPRGTGSHSDAARAAGTRRGPELRPCGQGRRTARRRRQVGIDERRHQWNRRAHQLNPCSLVTLPQAQPFTGGAIASRFEAPLGPTCIYKPAKAKTRDHARGGVDGRLAGAPTTWDSRQKLTVAGRHRAYCGKLGTAASGRAAPGRPAPERERSVRGGAAVRGGGARPPRRVSSTRRASAVLRSGERSPRPAPFSQYDFYNFAARRARTCHGRRGHDRLPHRRSAGRGRRRGDRRPRQLRPRPPREPGRRARAAARSRIVAGRHPRPRAGRPADARRRRRLPPGGDPHHAVRRGAAARARGARRRHLQRARGGRPRGRAQGRGRVVGVGLRPGRGVPDRPRITTRTPTTRSTARPRRSTRACCAASTRCTGSTTSRCGTSTSTGRAWTSTASTPRCWSAGWSASPRASRR